MQKLFEYIFIAIGILILIALAMWAIPIMIIAFPVNYLINRFLLNRGKSIEGSDWWIVKVSIVITLLANLLLAIILQDSYERLRDDNLILFIVCNFSILIVVSIIYYFKSKTTVERNAKETVQKHKKTLEEWKSFQTKYKKLIDSDIYIKVKNFTKSVEEKYNNLCPGDTANYESIPNYNERVKKANKFYDDSITKFSKFLKENKFKFTEDEIKNIVKIETEKFNSEQFNQKMLEAKTKHLEGYIRRYLRIEGNDYRYNLDKLRNFLKDQNILLNSSQLEEKIEKFIEKRNQRKFEKDFLD